MPVLKRKKCPGRGRSQPGQVSWSIFASDFFYEAHLKSGQPTRSEKTTHSDDRAGPAAPCRNAPKLARSRLEPDMAIRRSRGIGNFEQGARRLHARILPRCAN